MIIYCTRHPKGNRPKMDGSVVTNKDGSIEFGLICHHCHQYVKLNPPLLDQILQPQPEEKK